MFQSVREVNFLDSMHIAHFGQRVIFGPILNNFWIEFLDSSTYLVKYFWIILQFGQIRLEDNRRKRGTLKCEMILALKRKIICPKNVKF